MRIVENPGAESSGSQILHPGSRKLFCYWEALRAERSCPTREEFSLKDLPEIVPDLFVMERDHLRKCFQFRLAGSRICDLYQDNLTGQDVLAGWDGFEHTVIEKHLVQSIINLQPTLMRMRLQTDNKVQVAAEFLGLPIRMRGSERLQIIGGIFPFRAAKDLLHHSIVKRELLAIRSVWTEYQEVVTGRPFTAQPGPRFSVINGGMN